MGNRKRAPCRVRPLLGRGAFRDACPVVFVAHFSLPLVLALLLVPAFHNPGRNRAVLAIEIAGLPQHVRLFQLPESAPGSRELGKTADRLTAAPPASRYSVRVPRNFTELLLLGSGLKTSSSSVVGGGPVAGALPELDHRLKTLANATLDEAVSKIEGERSKGYEVRYVLGSTKISVRAGNASSEDVSGKKLQDHIKISSSAGNEGSTGNDCTCIRKNPLQIECTGFSCNRVPQNLAHILPNITKNIAGFVAKNIRHVRFTKTTIKVVQTEAFVGWGINITTLCLDHNQIAWIEERAFSGLVHLRELDISFNKIRRLHADAFHGLLSLKILSLENNYLERMPDVAMAARPKNLPELKILRLKGNFFAQILEEDLQASNTSSLEDIDLAESNIQFIHPKALTHLHKLETLKLDGNRINPGNLEALVPLMPNLMKSLSLGYMELRNQNVKRIFKSATGPRIRALALNGNNLISIDETTFDFLPYLEELDLTNVSLSQVEDGALGKLSRLKKLILSGHKLRTLPGSLLTPTLEHLSLQNPILGNPNFTFNLGQKKFHNMSRLIELDLSNSPIHIIRHSAFEGLRNLRSLKLQNCSLGDVEDGVFQLLPRLTYLSLNDNPLLGRKLEGNKWILNGTLIDELHLSGTGLTGDMPDFTTSLKQLRVLNLSKNKITRLNAKTFQSSTKLRTVHLAENKVKQWKGQLFNHEHSTLSLLDLRDNNMNSVTGGMLQDFDKFTHLAISGNNFSCDCNLVAFARWLRARHMNLTMKLNNWMFNETIASEDDILEVDQTMESWSALRCATPPEWEEVPLLKFDMSELICKPIHISWTRILIFTGSFLAGFVVLAMFLYKYRWYVRYYAFLVKTLRNKADPNRNNARFRYDAFVSYSNEDAAFVSRLVSKLESEPPQLRLCVYERDFNVGGVISEEIVQAIHDSRRTVLVVSEGFARSQWCKWELHLAQHRLHEEERDSMVVVKLGDIPKELISSTLSYLMKTRIYLEWSEQMDDEKKEKLFWARLKAALRSPADEGSLHVSKIV